jgi:hypothetical protein
VRYVTKREKRVCIAGFCTLMILAVSLAACTTPDPGINNTVTAPSQPVQTDKVTATLNQQSPEPVLITINSANKMQQLNNSGWLPGNILLVLNITIKNTGIQEGFVFTNTSITLLDLESNDHAGRSLGPDMYRGEGFENPLISPTRIEKNDTVTGQIIFGITDSKSYRLILMDNDQKVLLSRPINFDNLITTRNPVTLTINSMKKVSKLNTTTAVQGQIFLILNISVKNNDIDEGFPFTDRSITVRDQKSGYYVAVSLNLLPGVQNGLENPIIPPITIKQNDTITGQVLFGITDSDKYKFSLLGKNKTVIWSKITYIE